MTIQRLALVMGAILFLHGSLASAQTTKPDQKPILSDQTYNGPIPQSTLTLRVGIFAGDGRTNEEMIAFLDGRVRPPFEVTSEDFETALAIDLGYTHKPHPRFGVRVNGSFSSISSTSSGDFVPQVDADSLLPQLEYDREFKVDLIVVEGSGIYYFTDASTATFQYYLGGGFSVGFPHQQYTESRTDVETGQPFGEEIPGRPAEASEWDVSPGVHGVFGLLYYLNDRWGVSAEARGQFMESRFDQLQAYDPETGEFENVSFVVKYSGFYLTVGASYGF